MAVTPEMIMQVRYEVQDVTPGLYILDDTTLTYFLTKNNENVPLASMDAARAILMRLSITATDEVIDIMSIKGSTAAREYRQALELYLKNPNLNPLIRNLKGWIGGISKSEMATNDTTLDNNFIQSPSKDRPNYPIGYSSVGF